MSLNPFALTTLSQNPEYFEEVINLIEQEFHYSETHHYEKDFAPLVDPLNFENCFLYIDSNTNEVAAHLAVCLRTLVKSNIETRVAFIGGIVTHKKYRNQNLFKNLMDHALKTFEKEVSLFVLWSDLETLYERFSFFRTGGIVETGKRNLSASERPSGYEKTKFPALSDEDFKQIIHLYHSFNENTFYTVKREEKDWSIIKEMNSIDLYIKRDVLGSIKKYFCINKGRDLTNIIHEISCQNTAEYLIMLKELAGYKVWLPETELDKLNASGSEIFYTAFIRIGSLDILNEFIDKVSGHQLRILKLTEESVLFEFTDKSYETSHKDFLQYLLGPKPLDEFKSYDLSLYIAGADSI